MSVPVSLRVGPFTPTVLVRKRYMILYIFLIAFSFIPIMLEFWLYWQLMFDVVRPLHFFFFLPLVFFIMYVSIVFAALFFAKIFLIIINAFHKPREGVFLRVPSDKDYRYWSLRNTIRRWPVWLAHKYPFPFLDNICFKVFGVKTKFSNSLFEGWVDCEFIEFGKNVVVGQASIIQSALIIGNLLIIKKTIIEDNVRIGAHSIVMPGGHLKENCVLAARSVSMVDQVLEEGYIYVGWPAEKYKKNRFFEDHVEERIDFVRNVEGLRAKYEEIYDRGYHEPTTHKERKIQKKEYEAREQKRKESTL